MIFSIPFGVLSGGLLLFTVPRDFPYQENNKPRQRPRLENVDFLGALLMLSAVALIISGFEQAASLLSWRTAKALGPLCASAVAWIAFFTSQYWHDHRLQNPIQPVFPWRFCQNRVILGLIMCVQPWKSLLELT